MIVNLFALLVVANLGAVGAVVISTDAGTSAALSLPSFQICPNMSLNDPKDELLLKVENGEPAISVHVQSRTSLGGSVGYPVFTLLNVTYADEGAYMLEKLYSRDPSCERIYELTLRRESGGTGYWLSWESWSSCDDTTCPRGLRHRTRSCSIPSRCYHGSGEECEQNVTRCVFYAWSPWSAWSACSATCGTGRMRRQRTCWQSTAEDSTLDQCIGETKTEASCTRESCLPTNEIPTPAPEPTMWSTWGSFGACSASCGSGVQTKERKCIDAHGREVRGYCSGEARHDVACRVAECEDNSLAASVTWTLWGTWSTCSTPCGTGWQTRDRNCVDQRSRVAIGCSGDLLQNNTCNIVSCNDLHATAAPSGEIQVSLPLSTVVGGVAGVFILLLLVVIVVLVVVLRRRTRKINRRKQDTRTQTTKFHHDTKRNMKVFTRKKSDPRLSSHVYAEIDDDDVICYRKEERGMSVGTIDNTYAALPVSAGSKSSTSQDRFEYGPSMTYVNSAKEPTVGYRSKRLDSAGYLQPLQLGPKTKVHTNQ